MNLAHSFTLTGGADAISGSGYGTIYSYTVPTTGGYAPNGNILQHVDSVMGTWSFNYDAVDRLTSAASGSNAPSGFQSQTAAWTYDSYGNRTAQTFSGNNTYSNWATYNSANNRIATAKSAVSGYVYDASGNTLNDGNNKYWYDAEGQLCAVQSQATTGLPVTQYVYDAEGARIAKTTISAPPTYSTSLCAQPLSSGYSLTARYLVDLGGNQVTEINSAGSWQHSNVFSAARLTATYDYNGGHGGLHYELADPLGTKRVQANISGQIETSWASLPFGDALTATQSSLTTADDATEHHFTGKERDAESGNDYFGARYYASSMGRWMSPDPINLTNARLLNPANTLNKYAYGANNPLKFVDKDGKDITIFYEPDGSGHIFLAAVNPDKGTSAFLSFGPKDHGVSKIEAVAGVPGEFNFPADILGASSLTIQTNPEVTQQVIALINQMNSGAAPDFYALSRNCTTEVQDALKDLGLDFGDIDPATFWKDIYDRFSEDVKDNPFKGLPYLSAPHAPGKEYGSPRDLGMNYRQLLQGLFTNQQLQPQKTRACVTTEGPNGPETTCE